MYLEPQRHEPSAELKKTLPVHTNESISSTPLNSTVKPAPLFRMVSVPDEQVPGLNHLVNRPWPLKPRSKRPVRGTIIFLFHYFITFLLQALLKKKKN